MQGGFTEPPDTSRSHPNKHKTNTTINTKNKNKNRKGVYNLVDWRSVTAKTNFSTFSTTGTGLDDGSKTNQCEQRQYRNVSLSARRKCGMRKRKACQVSNLVGWGGNNRRQEGCKRSTSRHDTIPLRSGVPTTQDCPAHPSAHIKMTQSQALGQSTSEKNGSMTRATRVAVP